MCERDTHVTLDFFVCSCIAQNDSQNAMEPGSDVAVNFMFL